MPGDSAYPQRRFEPAPRPSVSMRWLLGTIAGASFYVVSSSRSLPEVVASHFLPNGVPNAFVPRNAYTNVMLLLVVATPLGIALLMRVLRYLPTALINLPNKSHWLAPARRASTFAWLEAHAAWLGVLIATFLAFVHSRVVAANALVPPRLDATPFAIGLCVFAVAVLVWGGWLHTHFRRVAD